MAEGARPERTDRMVAIVLAALGVAWFAVSCGLVASNDGSHLALARALALRQTTAIDPDVALTLWIDLAERGGHTYSDRPPGTAFAALPAVWLGARLDPLLAARMRATGRLMLRPASDRYAQTYVARARQAGWGAALADFQGTALLLRLHTALMGVAGLAALDAWLRSGGAGRRARLFALLALGAGTLWGPYSTVLFSHVTAGSAWCLMLLATGRAAADPRPRWPLLAGLAGSWAVACDFLLAVPIVLQLGLLLPPRRWPLAGLGALPLALATGAYHWAAFGAPWALGYDFQVHFEFARDRGATFAGDFVSGLSVLLGTGRGAGLLAQAPIVFLGVAGLLAGGRWRLWLPLVLWLALLAVHQTPWGGATLDHRYLVPALPLAGLGLAESWRRWLDRAGKPGGRPLAAAAVVLLTLFSTALVWTHFLDWSRG